MSDNKHKAVMYCRVGNKEQLSEPAPAFVDRGGMPCGGSMYEILSMHKGYDDITFAAMELILEKGPDALMHQLSYSDIELIEEEYPTVYERAIELGILTEEE
jgi:hypothetical protein